MDWMITCDASKVSPSQFLDMLRPERGPDGEPVDISRYPQAAGFYLRGGCWMKARPWQVGKQEKGKVNDQ